MKKIVGISEALVALIFLTTDTLKKIPKAICRWRKEWRIARYNRNRYKMQCERYNYEN